MTAIIFDGRQFAKERGEEIIRVVGNFRPSFAKATAGKDIRKAPKLVAILIGSNPESEMYLKLKEKKAAELGVIFEFRRFSEDSPQKIIEFIQEKNKDASVTGIVVELPLPDNLDKYDILDKIEPKKDVDCLTKENLRLLKEGNPRFVPPTVKAVGEILKLEIGNWKLEAGKRKLVVVGSRGAVGKGILAYLKGQKGQFSFARASKDKEGKEGLEIIGIDKETKDLGIITKTADVLISATGVGHLIKKEMVKEGATVIDVGIEKKGKLKVVGDVDFEQVKEVASFITPVPGGVGPVTIICLMENLLQNC